jgi:rhodanese-related sulfurtransferase
MIKKILLLVSIILSTSVFSADKRVQNYYADISAKEAYKLQGEGVVLLDIRTKREYNQLHPKGSVLLPAFFERFGQRVENKNFVAQVGNLLDDDTEKPIVLICRSGSRSNYAGNLLADAGYEKVYNVKHGFAYDWLKVRLPTER